MRKSLIVGVLASAITLGMTPSLAWAKSPTVVQVRTSVSVPLSDAGATLLQVEAVTLPAGSWTITTNATAVNFGAGDYVRCNLQTGGSVIDGGATVYLANRVAGIVNAAAIDLNSSATVGLFCDHDHAAASHGQFYMDPGVTMTAVKGGPIKAPGISGTNPNVVESRSTKIKALKESQPVKVASVKLSPGTWTLTAGGSAVNFSSFDWAACDFTASAGTVTQSFTFVGTESTDATVANLDLEGKATVPAGGATVELDCFSEFTTGVYIDPGATVTATKVSVKSSELASHVQLSDAAGVSTPVFTATMPAGAWRVRSGVTVGNLNSNNSVGGPRDFLRCRLLANGAGIDGGATAEITENSALQEIVNAGSFTSSKQWTLTLTCSHDAAHSGDGHWDAFNGDLGAVNQGPIG